MPSVNKAIIVGHLGADPEVRNTQDGEAIANISIATSESWKDKTTGEKKEATEWHRVVFFGRLAQVCSNYLKKGDLIYVEGSLRTRKWQDKSGNDRYTTEIRGDRMQMLGGKESGEASQPQKSSQSAAARASDAVSFADMDDDIPF